MFVALCFGLFSLYRKLGLDLVPRKDSEMVDPSRISIVELYEVVSCTMATLT